MPWKSKKQQAWGHSPAGEKALGGPSAVSEWDDSTDFSKLPEEVEGGAISKALKSRRPGKPAGVLGKRFHG